MVTWCEILLSHHIGKLGNEAMAVEQALVWCLVCPHSQVRLAAQNSSKKLVASLGGGQLAADLLSSLTVMMQNAKVQVSS